MSLQPATTAPPALDNPLEDLLGYQLRRASAAMLADLGRCIAGLELTVTEMSVLLLIEANPQVTQSEIGRVFAIQRANMAPLTAGLSRRGLILREAVDRRSHGLTLTAEGAAVAAEARRRVTEHEARFLACVPAGQRAALLGTLRSLWTERPGARSE